MRQYQQPEQSGSHIMGAGFFGSLMALFISTSLGPVVVTTFRQ